MDSSKISFSIVNSQGQKVDGYTLEKIERHPQEKDMLLINLKFNDSAEINSAKGVLKHELQLNSSDNSIVSTNSTPFLGEEIQINDVYYFNSAADKATKTAG